ncbi:type A chloramphenicol O-acetyltransferase [Cohnella sp. REN36]|uniref:type A chloramphenicol O-acetyltransferase n=1 Tax=Cohnella sp. REN36 TaxID=2887347 RepID=UPI001D14A0EC|nr:type A chloramphenicol O-acetyltransferase [Cohnella sp. REN36]MCC3371458.1 type A chloramphenicol O-acetyltransferase [Cohnella sp. REN36]
MTTFHLIDRKEWAREPYFAHYSETSACAFGMTANLDVTLLLRRLRERKVKLYPAFLYMTMRSVHIDTAFRTSFDGSGRLGYWERMEPVYTIFHPEDRTFSAIWTPFENDFARFHASYEEDRERYGGAKGLFTKPNVPANVISISSIPWTSFTSFQLQLYNKGDYLLPIVTGVKWFASGERTLLPVSLQVHHAVCDGYHASLFLNEMQRLADTADDWLDG